MARQENSTEAREAASEAPESALGRFLAARPQIEFIRFQWQDYSGYLRARVVPVEHASAIQAGRRRLHISPIAFSCIVDNTRMPGLDYTGSHELVPDWGSIRTRRLLDASHASVMCRVLSHVPVRSQPHWSLCPRHALETVVAKAARTLRARFLVGFEVEFEVMKASASNKLVPYSRGLGRFAVAGLRDPCYAHLEEAVRIMVDDGRDQTTAYFMRTS